ncbi:MAG: hypothetical protein CUN55_13755 [Phototrophicales bacterium]|nr:MAG: hypothetical protein CUN55_13755 [Phototrophicales bacterium]
MATFWFISAPLYGHLDWGGYLKTAQALHYRGHKVIWISQPPIQEHIQNQGIAFEAIQETGWLWPPPPLPEANSLPPQEAVFIRYRRALDTWLSEDLIPEAVENLLALAERINPPDIIVTDPFISASAIAAEKIGCKMAVCGWPAQRDLDESKLLAVQKELAQISRQRIQRLCAQFGVKGENFATGPTPSVQSPHLHISYFNKRWYQNEPPFLPQTVFVGGSPTPPKGEPPRWQQELPPAPAVLITLGSVFTGDLGFFAWAAQAVARLGWLPIVVIGRQPFTQTQKEELKRALPPHTRLLNWVDYDHLMPHLHLVVHHGGMGTTHAALVHGIPQVVVPHAADQRAQAKRVSYAKVGLNLSAHDVRNGQLLPAIRAVGTDEKVRQTAQRFAQELANLGGSARAAEYLESLL